MDVETSEAIEGLGGRIDALGVRLDDSIGALELRIDTLETRLDRRIDTLETTLREEMASMKEDLRSEITDSRRHSDVMYESLRDDIRILAEAVAGIATRLDSRGV